MAALIAERVAVLPIWLRFDFGSYSLNRYRLVEFLGECEDLLWVVLLRQFPRYLSPRT